MAMAIVVIDLRQTGISTNQMLLKLQYNTITFLDGDGPCCHRLLKLKTSLFIGIHKAPMATMALNSANVRTLGMSV